MIGTCLFTQIERSVEQALILSIAAKGLHEYRAMLRCEISTFMRSCPDIHRQPDRFQILFVVVSCHESDKLKRTAARALFRSYA